MARFDLDTYVPVSERLSLAIAAGVQSIQTTAPTLLSETMGFVQATVTMKDGRSASGTASFQLGLSGKSAQATSPLEDAETSALGRALAFLGFESTRGIASREEIVEARRRSEGPRQPVDVRGVVRAVQTATNARGETCLRFTLLGESYVILNAQDGLADGDRVTLTPGANTAKGTLATLISVDAAQAAA